VQMDVISSVFMSQGTKSNYLVTSGACLPSTTTV
jgi:hypothetical protein